MKKITSFFNILLLLFFLSCKEESSLEKNAREAISRNQISYLHQGKNQNPENILLPGDKLYLLTLDLETPEIISFYIPDGSKNPTEIYYHNAKNDSILYPTSNNNENQIWQKIYNLAYQKTLEKIFK